MTQEKKETYESLLADYREKREKVINAVRANETTFRARNEATVKAYDMKAEGTYYTDRDTRNAISNVWGENARAGRDREKAEEVLAQAAHKAFAAYEAAQPVDAEAEILDEYDVSTWNRCGGEV